MDFFDKLSKKASETYQVTKEKASNLSEELKIKCLQDYFKDHQEYPIITYCNRCLKGVQMAGLEGAHLLDLLMNETDIFNEKG